MEVAARQGSSVSGGETIEAGRLFEEHSERILGFCLRELRSRSEAEDALQTTFLYAHRALQRGVVPQAEYVWLQSIARNVCRWQRRTSSRRDRLRTAVELDVASPPGFEDEEEDLLVGLPEALASIPESQQRALVLRELHGLSSSEVAAQLGMSSPATYALLTRARRSLAHALTTLPEKTALGVITLVYELRSNLKALFGGSTAVKTVAATSVVAVAIGGVSVERLGRGDRGVPPAAPEGAIVDADAAGTPLAGEAGGSHSDGARGGAAATRSTSSRPGLVVREPDPGPGDAPEPESSPGDGVASSQPPVETGGTSESDPVELTELAPAPSALPLLPRLPTDLLPPAPELVPAPELPVAPGPPPTPSLEVPEVELPVPTPPDPGLPHPPP